MNFSVETVTFFFTDIESSTPLWSSYPDQMSLVVDRHNAIAAEIINTHSGTVFKNTGDGLCAAFHSPVTAVEAAVQLQTALLSEAWEIPEPVRVRMALHTGSAQSSGIDYKGLSLSRVARILQAGHGGQILLSEATYQGLLDYTPDGIGLMDLGLVRLRGLQRPDRIHQVCAAGLPDQFPPLRSLDKFPNNIPVQLTSFVGREQEIDNVGQFCRAHRLVTLTGSGGCGKTRLALQAAAELVDEYPLGVWLVELAALTDPTMIAGAISRVLGLREENGSSLRENLISHCESESILLIMDNCEHLIDSCAAVANDLVMACPGVHIIATSRERLNVPGEVSMRIDPLSSPGSSRDVSPDDVLRSDAGQLFVDRALSADSRFVLSTENARYVAQICRHVEGIPLAMELAAARVRVLTARQISERLSDRFRLLSGGSRTVAARQQTLEATVDWSYDLLTEPERTLLCRLAVFSSGWTVEAAEAICSGGIIDEFDVLDLLDALVNKSLVSRDEYEGGVRFRLLETIRAYALRKLNADSDLDTLRKRHAEWYTAYAVRMEPELTGASQVAGLNLLEREQDNVRAALETLRADPSDSQLRLASAFYRFWYNRGPATEGVFWLEECYRKHRDEKTVAVARAANRIGNFAKLLGDLDKAEQYFGASKLLFIELGDQEGIASAMNNLASVAFDRSDFDQAREICAESLRIYKERGDHRNVANVLNNIGVIALKQQDYEGAIEHFHLSRREFEHLGDLAGLGTAHHSLANTYLELGMLNESGQAFVDCLETVLQTKHQLTITDVLDGLAQLSVQQGEPGRAAMFLGKADSIREAADIRRTGWRLDDYLETMSVIKALLGEAEWKQMSAAGAALTLDQTFYTKVKGFDVIGRAS